MSISEFPFGKIQSFFNKGSIDPYFHRCLCISKLKPCSSTSILYSEKGKPSDKDLTTTQTIGLRGKLHGRNSFISPKKLLNPRNSSLHLHNTKINDKYDSTKPANHQV
eukprot:TRINITY_DN14207_c0_g1_i2.p1 TRINITY_DN14207_c0_g1~~TRINITY_DN14207_c0_g1_i2.p1  ORF type:complete len:108 (+),score=10.56 TRINITY_DN14207_c0_g1_i2:106-429(+)